MNFFDGSLFPENQQKLVITAAPYGPEWMPSDFPEDIPVTMEEQIQKAVDCYNAGATVLHLHCRELDGHGSKRLSMFNELLAGIRARVPDMILQVGGSISFAPEGDGDVAKWLSDDTRHMLADLDPAPDQVTIAINTNQMNVIEQMCEADIRGTTLGTPEGKRAYSEMTIPAGPVWVEEHIRRLSAKGIQTHFQLANITQLETVERMMRRGVCNVPLILTWVAIGGGFDQPNIYNLANFVRGCPDGSVLTLESSMLNVLPVNMMAIAMGLHVRCGNEDNIWTQRRDRKMGSIEQIEQLVRISNEFGRDIASCQEAREIYRIGEFYKNADETLAKNGFAPNRQPGERGVPFRMAG
ncbi:3-keto-5-aminohexanoate cleavage protein [Caulobacter sp. 17J65-9]|uniref:3-keto-5-aminohexanoate cleavage protein n=1 Tax=Caulobacter sp. 17J65-9 TaxID=2709382 RepID=UPI0013CAB2CC|nr:3-keto-5-aminohexanoate cleavage protein [Caulobacter sp. 17J65-9]NEX91386.1 3-keto-5-aminohexanoate cleavage protein [Caulobacter sp. 17J65-9]